MASIFDEVLTKGVRAGQMPARTEDARKWYRDTAQSYKRLDERSIMKSDTARLTNTIMIGSMYMYYYDPKHKATLPYYDRFPMIFPFRVESDRFWGLNLHYLPHTLRARLMDALYDTATNQRFDESTKLRMSYKMLQSASKIKFFEPCVKQYLYSQLNSKFLYVYPSEWDIALFLPLERFAKASKTQVWSQSKKMVGTK